LKKSKEKALKNFGFDGIQTLEAITKYIPAFEK